MPIKYMNPKTRVLNYNSASSFENAFNYYTDERRDPTSYELVHVAPDHAYIRNVRTRRVVVILLDCTMIEHTYYFRNVKQTERSS